MPDCLASGQYGTGMIKTNDARTDPAPDQSDTVQHFFGPVPDLNNGRRNADAGVSFLDADAQPWLCVITAGFSHC
jgi:hypothetical protein